MDVCGEINRFKFVMYSKETGTLVTFLHCLKVELSHNINEWRLRYQNFVD